jgi:nitroreductase
MPAGGGESAMNVIEAIHGRRSIRAYEAREPDRSLIEAMVWDAAQAPPPAQTTAQRLAFVVIEGRDRLAAMGERAKAFAAEHRPPGGGGWIDNPDFKVFWDAPAVILICAARDLPETEWDACRAAQNLMLSAHARGLGACWVGAPMAWLRSEAGALEVGIPEGYEPVAPVLIGWPQVTPPPREIARPLIIWRAEV